MRGAGSVMVCSTPAAWATTVIRATVLLLHPSPMWSHRPRGPPAQNALPAGARSGETRRMAASTDPGPTPALLRCGIVLHVQEEACQVLRAGRVSSAGFANPFPSPRTKRVSPGHLVAVAAAADGAETVVWRWYDAVVLGAEAGLVRLWEPAHGEVVAQARRPELLRQP